jgi:hypothetical protein
MAAHRKLDQPRDDLCADGLRKREPRLYAFSCCEPLFVWMPDVAAAHALAS